MRESPDDPTPDANCIHSSADQQRREILRRVNNHIGRSNHIDTEFKTDHADDGLWQPRWPGVDMKLLRSDGGEEVCLLRLVAGAELPPHTHATDEESVILQGNMWLDGEYCEAGDYHFAPQGSTHRSLFLPDGALLLVYVWGRVRAC